MPIKFLQHIAALCLFFSIACQTTADDTPPAALAVSNVEYPPASFPDTAGLHCPCFTYKTLDSLLSLTWTLGWWSDVPGCKLPPHHEMLEFWIMHAGKPNDDFNFSAQAGLVNGKPFASSAKFNHQTGYYDYRCGGETTPEIGDACTRILKAFIMSAKAHHPEMDYCGTGGATPPKIYLTKSPPFWTQWEFLIPCIIMIFVVGFSVAYFLHRRRFERKNQLLREQAIIIEKQQAVERERNRIASEMHDDVGSGLTTIRYLSDKAILQAKDPSETDHIRRIADHSNRIVRNMSEIIWAMNSRFDTAEDLLGYLRRYASEYLEEHHMPLSFQTFGEGLEQVRITGEKRRNVFLAFKELLHNAVKYSGAQRMEIRVTTGETLDITIIEVGGKGFDPETSAGKGNGLYNSRKQLETIGGILTFKKTPEAMITQICLPLQSTSYV